MQLNGLRIVALIASIMIFIAAFIGSAVNGALAITAINAGGIWYLLPLAGLAGIITSAMALGGKMDIKISSFVIGGIVLLMSVWFAQQSVNALDALVIMSRDISQGFNSSFFTGNAQDTSNIAKSSYGIALYLDVIGAVLMILVGALTKKIEIL